MKKIILVLLFLITFTHIFSDENKVSDMESISRVYYKHQDIPGYIFFEGFDFNGYKAESDGIEPMLEKTLELLQKYYGKNGEVAANHPFVFVGHSQGGLRALAMSTYLKKNDKELYKQLKGVVTLSGIDQGLKLLEDKGNVFRAKLYEDASVLLRGIVGIVKIFDFTPDVFGSGFAKDELIKYGASEIVWILAQYILGEGWDKTNDFGYPIMYNADWDGHAQVRDMVPQSNFIREYVLAEKTKYLQHKSKKEPYMTIEIRKGWLGIKYPIIVWKKRPIIIKTKEYDVKVDTQLSMRFLAGTNSNTLSMTSKEDEEKIRIGANAVGAGFEVASLINWGKSLTVTGVLSGSIGAAVDCGRAADWCWNIDREISELIGEKKHDGLVAESSQQLPEYNLLNSSSESKIFRDREYESYSEYNHANITSGSSEAKQRANDEVFTLLGL